MVERPAAPVNRRARRRAETTDEILAAAWRLAREEGLSSLSMRTLAERVGMRAPSLYTYFGSKHDIYDAMFAEGARVFEAGVASLFREVESSGASPREVAREMGRRFFAFCVEDPVRYQLLFQRVIPGFEPSAASYAHATAAYGEMGAWFARIGVPDRASLDLWTAVTTGLTSQQIANDPGGDRWAGLVERAVDMVFDEIVPEGSRTRSKTRKGRS